MAHCFECNAASGYGHRATCSKYHEALAALRKKWRDLETPDRDYNDRHYGLKPGMRGLHFVSGGMVLEVVHTDFLDNNRAQYRFYGGDRNGEEFNATAEHFTCLPKDQRCPECRAAVYEIFDHLGGDCSSTATEDPAPSEELTSPPYDGTMQGQGDTK